MILPVQVYMHLFLTYCTNSTHFVDCFWRISTPVIKEGIDGIVRKRHGHDGLGNWTGQKDADCHVHEGKRWTECLADVREAPTIPTEHQPQLDVAQNAWNIYKSVIRGIILNRYIRCTN